MSSVNQNKVTRKDRLGHLIAGILKYFATLATIPVGGTNLTPAALVERLQKMLDAIQRSSNAKAAWLASVQTERNTLADFGQLFRYIKAFVVTQFGETKEAGQKLEEFGFTPRKARTRDVASKAGAADKARGTRVARSTRGKLQKAPIKGNPVTKKPRGGLVTTAPAPAASPDPAPTPAPVKPAS